MNDNGASLVADLRVVVERLAASPEIQVSYLDALGVLPLVDEMALEFDDLYRPALAHLVTGDVSAEVTSGLARIDDALSAMSSGAETLWLAPALRDAAEWARVRGLARTVLDTWPAG